MKYITQGLMIIGLMVITSAEGGNSSVRTDEVHQPVQEKIGAFAFSAKRPILVAKIDIRPALPSNIELKH
jgi:hypothetical protein